MTLPRWWILGFVLPLAALSPGGGHAAEGAGSRLAPAQQAELREALAPLHEMYDPTERMLRRPFSSPGYHTTLTGGSVHPTRDSLRYALALLDTGEARWRDRACAILDRVIDLQDLGETNRTWGIWSWFLEEPLAEMSPPDWNWADFCGSLLLQVALDHRDRLPAGLATRLDRAVQAAAGSIRRRNVDPSYTNIAILGTYVTLVTAEFYQLPELKSYALDRLQRFHEHTFRHRAFTEYNSPTYTLVALEGLTQMRREVNDPRALRQIRELERFAWEEISGHFHAPTRQWAGPHSRAYGSLVSDDVLALIQRACGGAVDFGIRKPALMAHRTPVECPPDQRSRFLHTEPHTRIQTFAPGEPPVVGCTHFDPAFCLGSVSRGDFWNQRRPLLAYWGTPAAPVWFRVRVLRDGEDFAAAQFASGQQGGRVLGGIQFAVDGGQRHVSLDRMTNGVSELGDLRLRLEFGGATRNLTLRPPPAPDGPVLVDAGPVRLQAAVPWAAFDGAAPRWESGRDGDEARLDLVLREGARRRVDFKALNPAGVVLAVAIDPRPEGFTVPKIQTTGDRVAVDWQGLSLDLPMRPDRAGALRRSIRTTAGGAKP